jgi:hypothetical protein
MRVLAALVLLFSAACAGAAEYTFDTAEFARNPGNLPAMRSIATIICT